MLKGFYGKEPLVKMEGEAMLEARTPEEMEDEEDGRAEEGDEGTENEKKVNQWLIDDVVKDLVEMELNQRKKEGDEEGFKEGSLHWLKLKIWKVEQECKEEQAEAAKTSNNMRVAEKDKQRERADKANIMKELAKTTTQNKQMEISKEEPEYTSDLVFDSETEASRDLKAGGEETKDDLIPKAETRGAEALESRRVTSNMSQQGRQDPSSAVCNRWPQKAERHSREQ